MKFIKIHTYFISIGLFSHESLALVHTTTNHIDDILHLTTEPAEKPTHSSLSYLRGTSCGHTADSLQKIESILMADDDEECRYLEHCGVNLDTMYASILNESNMITHQFEGSDELSGKINVSQYEHKDLSHALNDDSLTSRVVEQQLENSVNNPAYLLHVFNSVNDLDGLQQLDKPLMFDEGVGFQDIVSCDVNLKNHHMNMFKDNFQIQKGSKDEHQNIGGIDGLPHEGKKHPHLVEQNILQPEFPSGYPLYPHEFSTGPEKSQNQHRMTINQIPEYTSNSNNFGSNLQCLDPKSSDTELYSTVVKSNPKYIPNLKSTKARNLLQRDDGTKRLSRNGLQGQTFKARIAELPGKDAQTQSVQPLLQEFVTSKRKSRNYVDRGGNNMFKKISTPPTTLTEDNTSEKLGFKLIVCLQYQGMLEMGVDHRISSKFSRLLKEVYDNLFQKIIQKNNCNPGYVKRLEISLHRAKNSLVKGFFGALGVLYHLHKGKFSKYTLISEGSVFLGSFLESWKSISPDEIKILASRRYKLGYEKWKWKNAKELLGYIMSLDDDTLTSYRVVLRLIEDFVAWVRFQQIPLPVDYNEIQFYMECKNIHKKRNLIYHLQSVRLYQPTQNIPTFVKNKKPQHLAVQGDPPLFPKKTIRRRQAFNLIRIKEFLSTQISFVGQIEKFFVDLKQSLIACAKQLPAENLETLQVQVNLYHDLRRANSQRKNHDTTTDDMFNKLIHVSHYHITSLFLYSLEVYHNHQTQFKTLQSTREDGWRFLQEYFQTWKDSLVLTNSGFEAPSRTPDWSNVQYVILHFLTWVSDTKPPYGFVKYLCDQWANEIYYSPQLLDPSVAIPQGYKLEWQSTKYQNCQAYIKLRE